jgi:hypothetical protein
MASLLRDVGGELRRVAGSNVVAAWTVSAETTRPTPAVTLAGGYVPTQKLDTDAEQSKHGGCDRRTANQDLFHGADG